MKDREDMVPELRLAVAMEDVARSLERLRPTGSGAMTCWGGRGAGDQQGSVEDEERSDETGGLARCAGVGCMDAAKTAFLIKAWRAEAKKMLKEAGDSGDIKSIATRGFAAGMKSCAVTLAYAAMQPDSEAPKERSGRRNAALSRPEHSEGAKQ